ncbi:AraC family transcriptional regulator [Paenibacillus koleovorans]|uniref:AraC family transcriptional regulator n=1 Tax=Paenibacillus koleovorans TaxID=121608 RepID=UPI000FDB6FEB|nr:AraC family transcriptional regulator [Paenibacillus koleovorans]
MSQMGNYEVAIQPSPGKGELVVLFAGQEQKKPAIQVGPQVRDYYLIHHVLRGKGSFQCMGSRYEVEAGQSFVIFPGELIRYDSDAEEPWAYRWVAFRGSMADQLLTAVGLTTSRPVATPANSRRTAALILRMLTVLSNADPGCELESGGLLRLMLAEFAKAHTSSQPAGKVNASPIAEQVERTIQWLRLQYAQPISIQQISQALGYHRTHLSKMFKQYTGMAPMQYLLKIRMDRAKLLLQEELTIEQVASSVGFADALYFSKQFKKWFGVTPTDFRNGVEAEAMEYNDCP